MCKMVQFFSDIFKDEQKLWSYICYFIIQSNGIGLHSEKKIWEQKYQYCTQMF